MALFPYVFVKHRSIVGAAIEGRPQTSTSHYPQKAGIAADGTIPAVT
jgi:hypothetical protein